FDVIVHLVKRFYSLSVVSKTIGADQTLTEFKNQTHLQRNFQSNPLFFNDSIRSLINFHPALILTSSAVVYPAAALKTKTLRRTECKEAYGWFLSLPD
ncbi:hypothetical protein, partial [Shewanella chilikensis]|uniref:hypothetical protein n=1 Tax=Shewanella chilikensis TaxID=558541 RepID=UPI003A96CD6E